MSQYHVKRWFLDGNLISELQRASLGADEDKWPNEEMYFMLSNGLQSAAPDSATEWPNSFTIDYIRLYKWGG